MLYQQWLIEAVRLREQQTGALEDAQAVRYALTQPADLASRLSARALFLAKRDGLIEALQQWLQAAKVTRWLLSVIAVLIGIGLSKAALLSQDGTVNVFLALLALLAANGVSLLVWLVSSLMRSHSQQTWLPQIAAWLSEKLARKAKQAQLVPALAILLQRQQALLWGIGKYLHLWWLLVLVSSLISVLLMLSTRRYGFIWESTLIDSATFSGLIHSLGTVPSWLGFPQPTAELIQRSAELTTFSETDRQTWAYWLVGLTLVYGIIPRAILALLSSYLFKRRLQKLAIDPQLPIWLELKDRLLPTVTEIIDPAPASLVSPTAAAFSSDLIASSVALVSLEVNPLRNWQPDTPYYLGSLASRQQRQQILDHLSQHPVKRLLVACSSVDRGSLNLLVELSQYTEQLMIWLLPETAELNYQEARFADWKNRLTQQQLNYTVQDDALSWLEIEHA